MGSKSDIEELRREIARQERQLVILKEQLAFLEAGTAGNSSIPSPGDASSQESDISNGQRNISWPWPLKAEEYTRYGRQLILPEIGLQGQLNLKASSVLIIGLGGLGCPAAEYLAGSGVGTLGLMDGDTVELSNLHRQILHTTERVGMLKVESARHGLRQLNPMVNCIVYPFHLISTSALSIFASYDLILDCTDHPTSRYLISDAAVLSRKILVSASALRTEGQLLVLNNPPGSPTTPNSGPCYRCVFPRPPPAESVVSCGEGGVLGPVVGIMGVLMALETIKIVASSSWRKPSESRTTAEKFVLVQKDSITPHSMLLFSTTTTPPFRHVRLRGKRPDCHSCSSRPTITADSLNSGSLDYAVFCGVTAPVNILLDEERTTAKDFSAMRQRRESKYVLIDVRDEVQYGICKLDGSVNVPISKIEGLASTIAGGAQNSDENEDGIITDRGSKALTDILGDIPANRDIFTICRFGNDSQLAVRKLKDLGYERLGMGRRIKDVKGGFRAWKEEVDEEWPEY